jgi:SSS family solute:Na+ symporter
MNYLTFGSWFFLLCVLLITAVSLATEEPKPEKVVNLTIGTVSSEEKKITRASFDWKDVSISIFVVLVVIFVMLWFNGR